MTGSWSIFVAVLSLFTVLANGTPISTVSGITLDQVVFTLYNRQNSNTGSRIFIGDEKSLSDAEFDPAIPIKIAVHGWMDDGQAGVIQLSKKEFLALAPMNIIGVSWSECSKVVLYEKTIECAKQVGEYIGDLVLWLQESQGISPEEVHAIGHSLGGQAISFVSRKVKLGRMTPLDPAGPLFTYETEENRIDPGDATFVDCFHTSTNIIGIKIPVGHIDFYPNGGAEQPNCDDLFGSCAHGTAYHYYANTISEVNRNIYEAYKCENLENAKNQSCSGERAVMGYGATPTTPPGIYYLNITTVPFKI